MEYNSRKNYDHLYNYNSASTAVNQFSPTYESFNISESVEITKTKSVSANETPIFFVDEVSISDSTFSVGSSSAYDSAYDWFLPLPMRVDWSSTSVQVMPTSESEYTDMPNVDGSMVGNTTYKNRSFSFVLYSNDGLSDTEKNDLKEKIVKILDGTKGGFKKLSIPPSDHYFDVKYSGSASIQDGPSFIKATLPFEVKPYSHPMFQQKITGQGTLTNGGLKDCGLFVEISGPVSNPSFRVSVSGAKTYSVAYSGDISSGSKLVIDNESMLCYSVDQNGVKKNEITKLIFGDFIKLTPGQSALIKPSENVKNRITSSINESYIW